ISKPAVRRLAATVGVKRLRNEVYEQAVLFIEAFLEDVLYDAAVYRIGARRKTILEKDVQHALQRRGFKVFG
ncbi:hypothetical protein Angca_006155, partial [Angiostrongylus cantonensis]